MSACRQTSQSKAALNRLNTCLPIPYQQAWPSCAAQNAGLQHAVIEYEASRAATGSLLINLHNACTSPGWEP